jgi:hypothetical protein
MCPFIAADWIRESTPLTLQFPRIIAMKLVHVSSDGRLLDFHTPHSSYLIRCPPYRIPTMSPTQQVILLVIRPLCNAGIEVTLLLRSAGSHLGFAVSRFLWRNGQSYYGLL